MNAVQKFLTDLYRDLDERHLLLPAIALVIAVIAAPFILSSPSPPPPVSVAPPPADSTNDATAAAVLTENPGVRDYRRRLEWLKSKNPFEARIAPPPAATGGGFEEVPAGGSATTLPDVPSTGSVGVGTSGAGGTSTSTSASDTTSVSTTSTTSGSGGSGGTSSSGSSSSKPETVIRLLAPRVDVKVGHPGSLGERNDVKLLEPLPGPSNPVFIFIGVSENVKRALFVVSSDASDPEGDGRCAPSGTNCQYLWLKKGESESFEYVGAANRYKLSLVDLDLVKVKTEHS